jgi:hypothetical protein
MVKWDSRCEVHGLPYTETSKGATKTLRTEENIEEFMSSIENFIYDTDTIWFDEGICQGGTNC